MHSCTLPPTLQEAPANPCFCRRLLILGKIEGRRRRGPQRMRWLDGITIQWTWVWVSSGSWWWTGKPDVLQSMELQTAGHDWTELNWTEPCSKWLRGWRIRRQCRRSGFNPGVGKIPWRRVWRPLQYSCLENPHGQEPGGLQSMGSQRVGHDWTTNHSILQPYSKDWARIWTQRVWWQDTHSPHCVILSSDGRDLRGNPVFLSPSLGMTFAAQFPGGPLVTTWLYAGWGPSTVLCELFCPIKGSFCNWKVTPCIGQTQEVTFLILKIMCMYT